jgi:hypothetical protein
VSSGAPTGTTRATLRLTTQCVNRCIFCAQDGIDHADIGDLASALAQARTRADEITFTGGEPATHPELLDAIAAAREAEFRAIGLQTNAAGLAASGRIEALQSAGLTDVHVSLHGGSAAVHDYHTGREGSYSELLHASERMLACGLEVVATTVLTRSNFRVLAAICDLLLRLRVSAWTIALPVTAGRAADDFDRIVPRLGLALPFALHALANARERGLPVALSGAPLCALGPHAELTLPSVPRAFADVCASCPARSTCPGLDAAYLERFTAEELHRRDAVAAAAPLPARIARMFVGIGELARRSPSLHPAPATARRSLPVLGKARPAQHETRGRSSTQSGESLRELFPTLFEPEET